MEMFLIDSCFFNDTSLTLHRLCSLKWYDNLWMMKSKGCGRS